MKGTEHDILEGCRRGDPRAQRALYDAMAPMAMGLCCCYCASRQEAEDVMMKGFVRVFEKIGSLHDAGSLRPWVYKVMLRCCIRQVRRRTKTEQQTHPVEQIVEAADLRLNLDPYGAEEILELVAMLPAGQRAAFNLCEVEGYSSDEAARLLGCSAGTVRSSLSRARERLRNHLLQK